MAGRKGFEPLSCGFGDRCFFQLNYPPIWSWQRDLNPRPTDYKSVALPLSYASIFPTLFILLWDRREIRDDVR